MNPGLYYLLALLLILGGGLCWFTNLFSLPGNWFVAGIVGLFAYLVPSSGSRGVSGNTVAILLALALVGEIIEFAAGAMGAAKLGASRRSIWLSLVGALAGSIAGALAGLPIPLIGSMVAALLGGSFGAFAGAYLGEVSSRRGQAASVAVAKSAATGRLWGTVGKFAVGAVMLGVTAVDAFVM